MVDDFADSVFIIVLKKRLHLSDASAAPFWWVYFFCSCCCYVCVCVASYRSRNSRKKIELQWHVIYGFECNRLNDIHLNSDKKRLFFMCRVLKKWISVWYAELKTKWTFWHTQNTKTLHILCWIYTNKNSKGTTVVWYVHRRQKA